MKRKLVATILGLAAAVTVFNGASALAQGIVTLDSYFSSPGTPYPLITFGTGSGHTSGTAIASTDGYTVGMYFSSGALTAVATSNGNLDTSTPGGTLATGLGSTATFSPVTAGLFITPDNFDTLLAAGVRGFVVVAYNGTTYANSTVRGHSQAFQLTTTTAPAFPAMGGSPGVMGPFQVVGVPEPSTFALAGLGLAGLLIFRRRK